MAVVETKVKASTAAAAVSGLVLWAMGRYLFRGSGVPDVVASWTYVIVPGLITFAAGYLAKHTSVTQAHSITVTPPPAPLMSVPLNIPLNATQTSTSGFAATTPPPPPGAAGEKPAAPTAGA